MKIRMQSLAAVAALAFITASAHAGPGNGGGNGGGPGIGGGNGGGHGYGGQNTSRSGQGPKTQSNGHGNLTSQAARSRETRGLEKALSVLETTPAAQAAKDAVQAALDRINGE